MKYNWMALFRRSRGLGSAWNCRAPGISLHGMGAVRTKIMLTASAGAAVDVYASTVRAEYVPYIMPQEYGNKTDVRWAALMGADGAGLLVTGAELFEVSVHPFTLQNLDQAKHTYELEWRDVVTLYVDCAQSGLGSAACGPGVLPQYELNGWYLSLHYTPETGG